MSAEDIEILEEILEVRQVMDELYSRKRQSNKQLFKSRDEHGFYASGVNILKEKNPDLIFKSIRMSCELFEALLNIVAPKLIKYSQRKAIEPEQRLYITLCFLAHGPSLHTLSMKFRIGYETARSIILETCDVLWNELAAFYVSAPSEHDWKIVASDFYNKTLLLNCVGAIDGKHIRINAPNNAGSQYYNYKKFHSIVLLAACDANYAFTLIDVGAFGSQSDGGVFKNSEFGKQILQRKLKIPSDARLPNSSILFPHYFVADAAFPLHPNIMKPYARDLDSSKIKYNASISKARVRIEMAFGILASKWRILHTSIAFAPQNARKIVLATVVLHNYLRLNASGSEIPEVDSENTNDSALTELERTTSTRSSSQLALSNRVVLCDYINSI